MNDWSGLAAGALLEVVKLAPDGAVAARYPGVVIAHDASSSWLTVRANWVMREIETDGLSFMPGDELHEFFSPERGFNVFSVFSPSGELRGWYANVTHPTVVDASTVPPALFWHDLYLDLIGLPDGRWFVRDEDELRKSGLESSDPGLYAVIMTTCDQLTMLFQERTFPFHER